MEKLVLHVPEWQGELVFSEETLIFVGVILLMVVGILFCFWGYKFFRTILFMGIGVVACYGSYRLVAPMTANSAVRMFLTVSLTFLGICFVYFLSIIWGYILDRLHIRTALGKRTYLLAAPAGAAILGLTIYYMIWRDEIVAGAVAAVCLAVGLIFQHVKRKKQVRFRSYDDLIRLPRPQFNEEVSVLAAADTAVSAAESDLEPETAESEPECNTLERIVTESEEVAPEAAELESECDMPERIVSDVSESSDLTACALETIAAVEITGVVENAGSDAVSVQTETVKDVNTKDVNIDANIKDINTKDVNIGANIDTNIIEEIEPNAYQETNQHKEKAHRHRRERTRADRERKSGKGTLPVAFAGGAALIAAGLGFLIANKVSKGGED